MPSWLMLLPVQILRDWVRILYVIPNTILSFPSTKHALIILTLPGHPFKPTPTLPCHRPSKICNGGAGGACNPPIAARNSASNRFPKVVFSPFLSYKAPLLPYPNQSQNKPFSLSWYLYSKTY